MAIPIPRISWGDGYTITAGVNDVVLFVTDDTGIGRVEYVAKIAAGAYSTPESLLAAFDAAIEAATGPDGSTFSFAGGSCSSAMSDGRIQIALGSGTTGSDTMLAPFDYGNFPIEWEAVQPYGVGDLVGTTDGRLYRCASSGTSGAVEPTSETSPVADGTAQWTFIGTAAAMEGARQLLGFASLTQAHQVTAVEGVSTFVAETPFAGGVWSPDVPVRSDVEREFESVVTQVETAGGQNKTTRWTPESLNGRRTYRRVRFAYLKPERVFTGVGGAVALETFWRGGSIGRFTYSPDRDNPAVGARDYFLRESSAREFKPRRMFDGVELYEIELEMGLFTE